MAFMPQVSNGESASRRSSVHENDVRNALNSTGTFGDGAIPKPRTPTNVKVYNAQSGMIGKWSLCYAEDILDDGVISVFSGVSAKGIAKTNARFVGINVEAIPPGSYGMCQTDGVSMLRPGYANTTEVLSTGHRLLSMVSLLDTPWLNYAAGVAYGQKNGYSAPPSFARIGMSENGTANDKPFLASYDATVDKIRVNPGRYRLVYGYSVTRSGNDLKPIELNGVKYMQFDGGSVSVPTQTNTLYYVVLTNGGEIAIRSSMDGYQNYNPNTEAILAYCSRKYNGVPDIYDTGNVLPTVMDLNGDREAKRQDLYIKRNGNNYDLIGGTVLKKGPVIEQDGRSYNTVSWQRVPDSSRTAGTSGNIYLYMDTNNYVSFATPSGTDMEDRPYSYLKVGEIQDGVIINRELPHNFVFSRNLV